MSFPPFDSTPHYLLQCDAIGLPGPLFHGGFFLFWFGSSRLQRYLHTKQRLTLCIHFFFFLKSDLSDRSKSIGIVFVR